MAYPKVAESLLEYALTFFIITFFPFKVVPRVYAICSVFLPVLEALLELSFGITCSMGSSCSVFLPVLEALLELSFGITCSMGSSCS